MKKLVLALLLLAVLAILANDGGRVFVARSKLRANTGTLASWAENNAGALTREQAATQLVERANQIGVRITQYGQDLDGIKIWTESEVTGLWVVGTYKATLDGVPLRQALGRSIVIKDYVETQYR